MSRPPALRQGLRHCRGGGLAPSPPDTTHHEAWGGASEGRGGRQAWAWLPQGHRPRGKGGPQTQKKGQMCPVTMATVLQLRSERKR